MAITHYCQARPLQQHAILDPVPPACSGHVPYHVPPPPITGPTATPHPQLVRPSRLPPRTSPHAAPRSLGPRHVPRRATHARHVRRRSFCGPGCRLRGWNRGMSFSAGPPNGMPPSEEEGRVKGGGWVAPSGICGVADRQRAVRLRVHLRGHGGESSDPGESHEGTAPRAR